jgi:hypothetical protein
MALLMLCRGLNAIDKAAAAATVDAMIALIDDGRLDGETFGAALHDFLKCGLVFPKRWPDRVRQIARTSRLALAVMRRAFERSLHPASSPFELRDLHAWLEILLELSTEMGVPITDRSARDGIDARATAGKAKAIGKALVDLDESLDDADPNQWRSSHCANGSCGQSDGACNKSKPRDECAYFGSTCSTRLTQ